MAGIVEQDIVVVVNSPTSSNARVEQDLVLTVNSPTSTNARVEQDVVLAITQASNNKARVEQDIVLVVVSNTPAPVPPTPTSSTALWGRGFPGDATLVPDATNTNQSTSGYTTGGGTAGGTTTGSGGGGAAGDLGASPFDVSFYFNGKPDVSFEILRVPVARNITFPAGLLGSQAVCETAPTSPASLTIKRTTGGVTSTIGSILFGAGAFVGTFTSDNAIEMLQGDILTIVAPNPADGTLATIGGTLAGTR
jgi:hypothetical protein